MTFLHKRFCASNQDYFKLLFGANADPRSPFLPADSVVVAALATAPSSAPSTTTAPVSAGGGRVAGAVKRSKGPEDAKDDDDEDDEAELPPEYRRSHRGKPCGHVFNKGEGVHRCRTCGADPTCVFCSRCFYATNHDGHDTSFSISSKGGGCCDCGDPEAWKIPQHCKYHSPAAESGSESLQPLPKVHSKGSRYLTQCLIDYDQDLVSAMRTVIATSLDFILDTFADCPEDLTLPETVESIYNANGWEVPQEEEQHRAGKMPYTLSLWNDETHSFEEVINKVMETTGCSTAEAEEVAKAVDGYGRQIIKTSPNVEELLQIGNSINSIKLAVTIRTSREVFREHIAVVALEWIAGLANSVKSGPRPFQGVTYEAPDELVRSLISDELCSERRRIKPFLIASLGGKWVPREPDAEEKQIDEMERLEMDTTRIDFCLMYDMRLWKTPRAILREMYISTIIKSGEAYRKKLAERFALKFLRLSRAYLLLDREYDLSIINLSVQLFTVPTLASHLIQNTNIIDTLVTILKTYCLADIHPNVYPLDRFYTSFRKSQSTRIPHYARLEIRQNGPLMSDRRVDSVFNDLYFLLSSPKVRDELFKQLEALPRNPFPTFLDACAVWQAMNPQERAARQHVEYESQTWQAAINWSSQIWTLCQIVGQCYGPPAGTAGLTTRYLTYAPEQDTLHRFQESLKSFSGGSNAASIAAAAAAATGGMSKEAYDIVEFLEGIGVRSQTFRVATQATSFYLPMHWALGCLLMQLPRLSMLMRRVVKYSRLDLKAVFTSGGSPDWIVEAARSGVWRSDRSLTPSEAFSKSPINYQERLARIIEYPLRVCVLLSQIRAGIWVRNGANMRSQAMYFRDLILRECNDTHVFLLQVGASAMGPTAFLTQVMNRFDLVEWFKGRMNHPTIFARIPGVDAQQVVSMVEDVLQLLIVVLTERGNVSGASVQSEMRKEIVHHLAVKKIGLPYSELTRRVPSTLVQWTDQGGVSGVEDEAMDPTSMWTFNDVLATVANFRAPEGASDTGLYELKEECYAEVDPWFWHYTRNQRMEVEEVLRARDDKRRKEVEEDMLDWQRQSWDAAQATVWNSVIDNPFVGLNDLAHSRVFSEILFFALSNVTKLPTTSATGAKLRNGSILADAIQLIVIGISLDKADRRQISRRLAKGRAVEDKLLFMDYATQHRVTVVRSVESNEGEGSSADQSGMDALEDEDLKEQAARVLWILQQFEEYGDETAKLKVREWRKKAIVEYIEAAKVRRLVAGTAGTSMSDGADLEDVEMEMKKRAALARKAAIMAQFAQQQKSFMEQHGEEFGDESEGVGSASTQQSKEKEAVMDERKKNERFWEYPSGTCMVCQEPAGIIGPRGEVNTAGSMVGGGLSPRAYGMLALTQTSYLLRQVDPDKQSDMLQTVGAPSGSDIPRTPPVAGEKISKAHPDNFIGGVYTSTCGHLMHVTCFQTYMSSIQQRHSVNRTRSHPENLLGKEFLCPLCKSLGNCLIPIVWEDVPVNLFISWNGTVAQPPATWNERILRGLMRRAVRLREQGHGDDIQSSGDDDDDGNEDMNEDADEEMDVDDDPIVLVGPQDGIGMDGERDAFLAMMEDTETANAFVQLGMRSQTPTSPFAESGQTSDSTSTTDALHSDNSPQNREDGMHELTTWAYRGVPYKGDLIYRLYRERFVQIVNMKFARINANHDRGLDDMDLLWETYSYTLMCVEAMTRGVAPPNVPESAPWGARNLMRVSVLDTANAQMLSLLRLMSRTITTYSATLSSEKLAELISRSSYRARGLFYGVLEAPHIADRAVRIAGQAVTAYRSAEYSSSVNGGWRSRLEPWVTARGDPFALIAIMWVMEITKVVIHQLASIAMRDCEGLLSPEVSTVAQKMLDDFGLRLDFELYDRLREDREAEMESEGNGERLPETTDDILKNMREFMLWVMVMLGMDEQDRIKVLRQLHPAVVVATIRNISLSYLRTAALLLYTRFHVVPPGGITGFFRDENTAASAEQYGKAPIYDGEFETLLAYLNLPSVSVVCSRRTMEDPFLSRVIAGWCMTCAVGETLKNKDTNAETQSAVRRGSNSRGASSATPGSNNNSELAKRLSGGYMPAFSIPGTYELITLPQRMDVLFNEWLTFICPECGTRPADPALCLICGQFVCFQSFCCSKQGEGECNSHMISCGGSVGVYLSLRQCTVLFLHGPGVKKNQGCFHSGPYLDPHGEIDIGLRRGRPMTLNQRRYDEIRRLWLTHSIPSVVARRIEQNYDMGGWPTL
ncbi:hypothetical protein BJ742DRAFT_683363 [Cladochytrium replicatum]|nr:hypothetical protein BJ742DRAFT_683363 [Cladochytrium replicatum]